MFISSITSILVFSVLAAIGVLLAFLSILRAKNRELTQDLKGERNENIQLKQELINAKMAAKIRAENTQLSDVDVDKRLHERTEFRD